VVTETSYYSDADAGMVAEAVHALDDVQAGYVLAWLAGYEPALVARAIATVMGVQGRVAQVKARHHA
jgi:hypothetical protein